MRCHRSKKQFKIFKLKHILRVAFLTPKVVSKV